MTKKDLEEVCDLELIEIYKIIDDFIRYLEIELGVENEE